MSYGGCAILLESVFSSHVGYNFVRFYFFIENCRANWIFVLSVSLAIICSCQAFWHRVTDGIAGSFPCESISLLSMDHVVQKCSLVVRFWECGPHCNIFRVQSKAFIKNLILNRCRSHVREILFWLLEGHFFLGYRDNFSCNRGLRPSFGFYWLDNSQIKLLLWRVHSKRTLIRGWKSLFL